MHNCSWCKTGNLHGLCHSCLERVRQMLALIHQ